MKRSSLVLGIHRFEHAALAVLLLLMAVIPVADWVGRRFTDSGIPGAIAYLRHLTLWVGFAGAVLATRQRRHLRIALPFERLPGRIHHWMDGISSCLSVLVCACLCGASLMLVVTEAPALPAHVVRWLPGPLVNWLEPFGLTETWTEATVDGWLPVWFAQLIMPVGFALMALRFVLVAPGWRGRALALLMVPLAAWLPFALEMHSLAVARVGVGLLLLAPFMGTPLFVVLGGVALLLFWGDAIPVAAVPTETYRIVASPIFPTIPLFTLAGFVMSEGRASERLVRVFQACFGSVPGGLGVAATLLCAFFTTFTGASGVTILALGGLLLPVLLRSGQGEDFSVGLLASTGSVGLLLPPSLVVILYGVFAQVPITDMFVAALVPGLLLVGMVCILCVYLGRRAASEREPFEWRAAWSALWRAKWEVAMPGLVLLLVFGGFCTLVEAAAFLVAYALFIECVVYRDIGPRKLLALLVNCGGLLGGVLIILGVAMGLTNYLVDAQVPYHAAEWVSANIHSRVVFLLALNVALILVGCLMDIYAALVVVVPLLLPMAEAFGIDRTHLGVIFLANLQLGYLTPPVGMNLFLASFRFERPLLYVSRVVLPFLAVMAVLVLLVTYVPALSSGVVSFFAR